MGRKLTTNTIFRGKANLIHNFNYTYYDNYIDNKTKIEINCKIHGIFKQTPSDHLQGYGCPKCGGSQKLTTEEFLIKAKIKHGDKYNYPDIYINSHTKMNIECLKHGVFNQKPNDHLGGHGCPICNESKGEQIIKNYLVENKISYIPQHKFDECKNKNKLPFDFYLPDYNLCIEFNGIQHYESFKHFGGINKLNKTILNDSIKIKYCEDYFIDLLIIKYDENIIQKLDKTFL
jgi:hypothetical protein